MSPLTWGVVLDWDRGQSQAGAIQEELLLLERGQQVRPRRDVEVAEGLQVFRVIVDQDVLNYAILSDLSSRHICPILKLPE